jgi:hypothetical protein
MVNSRGTPDATFAELLDGYYRHAEDAVEAVGGRMVKFMGASSRSGLQNGRLLVSRHFPGSSETSTHGGRQRAGTRVLLSRRIVAG